MDGSPLRTEGVACGWTAIRELAFMKSLKHLEGGITGVTTFPRIRAAADRV